MRGALLRPAALLLGLVSVLGFAGPAAATFFTIDGNGNAQLEFSPTDDLAFSLGNGADGTIHAVDFTGITAADIESSIGTVSFATQDVLFFSITLSNSSATVSQINAAVGTVANVDPAGIGYLLASVSAGDDPDSLNIQSGGGFFPGAGEYGYNPDTLVANETTRILFLTWSAGQLAIGQTATFMLQAGTSSDFMVQIVPEPSTWLLLGAGISVLAHVRRRRLAR